MVIRRRKMKVFGKWLAIEEKHHAIAASFKTKKEAINTMNDLFGESDLQGKWTDGVGHTFHIEKNTTEY
jgi:hypothetical protein